MDSEVWVVSWHRILTHLFESFHSKAKSEVAELRETIFVLRMRWTSCVGQSCAIVVSAVSIVSTIDPYSQESVETIGKFLEARAVAGQRPGFTGSVGLWGAVQADQLLVHVQQ